MSNMVFQAAILRAGKLGVIKPDAAGYYEQCIGGLDIQNSNGVTYAATDKVRNLFANSESLQRRVKDRALKGELGHPRRTSEYGNDDAWLHRLNDIVESNVSTYWSKIELDENYGRNNPHLGRPGMIGIMGRFRPGGVGAQALERDLADPEANVAFSIRAFSIPCTRMGRPCYDLQTIVTWDQVNEPGLEPAKKTLSATMEAKSEQSFTTRQIKQAIIASEPTQLGSVLSTNESRNNLIELSKVISIDSGISKPVSIYYNWK